MWTAIYKDGTKLKQYTEEEENLFRDIEMDRLESFVLKTNYREIILNINTGEFRINGTKLSFGYKDVEHKLIYFRRVQQRLGGVPETYEKEYIGWQTNFDEDNVKVILGIEENKVTIHTKNVGVPS